MEKRFGSERGRKQTERGRAAPPFWMASDETTKVIEFIGAFCHQVFDSGEGGFEGGYVGQWPTGDDDLGDKPSACRCVGGIELLLRRGSPQSLGIGFF